VTLLVRFSIFIEIFDPVNTKTSIRYSGVIQTLSLRVHQPEVELHQPAEAIITRLVQLLASERTAPRASVAALRALGALCVGIGYAPRLANQKTVSDVGGLERLLEMSTCSETADDGDDDLALVHVEASLTFALVQIGMISCLALYHYYLISR